MLKIFGLGFRRVGIKKVEQFLVCPGMSWVQLYVIYQECTQKYSYNKTQFCPNAVLCTGLSTDIFIYEVLFL